jgi:hypothetical protein
MRPSLNAQRQPASNRLSRKVRTFCSWKQLDVDALAARPCLRLATILVGQTDLLGWPWRAANQVFGGAKASSQMRGDISLSSGSPLQCHCSCNAGEISVSPRDTHPSHATLVACVDAGAAVDAGTGAGPV